MKESSSNTHLLRLETLGKLVTEIKRQKNHHDINDSVMAAQVKKLGQQIRNVRVLCPNRWNPSDSIAFTTGVSLLTELAEEGSRVAALELGHYYKETAAEAKTKATSTGIWGADSCSATSLAYYQKAAAQGDAVAERFVAKHHENDENWILAWVWYTKIQQRGEQPSVDSDIKRMQQQIEAHPHTQKEFIASCHRGAERGDTDSQFHLGFCYEHGILSEDKDMKQAENYYKRAADQGHSDAYIALGNILFSQMSDPINYPPSNNYFRKLLKHYAPIADEYKNSFHNPQARFLTRLSCDLDGIANSFIGSIVYKLRVLAHQRNTEAEFYLGTCYEHGISVKKHEKTAIQWYEWAAEEDHIAAQMALGHLVAPGEINGFAEVRWFKKATETRHRLGGQPQRFVQEISSEVPKQEDKKGKIIGFKKPEFFADLSKPLVDKLLVPLNPIVTIVNGVNNQLTSYCVEELSTKILSGAILLKRADFFEVFNQIRDLAQRGNITAQTYLGRSNKIVDIQSLSTEALEANIKSYFQRPAPSVKTELVAVGYVEKLFDKGSRPQMEVTQALHYLKEFANKGCMQAQMRLASLYVDPGQWLVGVAPDAKQAVMCYRKAAQEGSTIAQDVLISAYSNNKYEGGKSTPHLTGVEPDDLEALHWCHEAAKQGHLSAQKCLAFSYSGEKYTGLEYNSLKINVTPNDKLAFEWFYKAAQQGDAQSQSCLGVCYHEGLGVEQDFDLAYQWYQKGAPSNPILLEREFSPEAREERAAKARTVKLLKSAENNNQEAQYLLGLSYEHGVELDRDVKKAAHWYGKAAEQGYPPAQDSLSRFYREGLGVDKDKKLAEEWHQKAAKQGFHPYPFLEVKKKTTATEKKPTFFGPAYEKTKGKELVKDNDIGITHSQDLYGYISSKDLDIQEEVELKAIRN